MLKLFRMNPSEVTGMFPLSKLQDNFTGALSDGDDQLPSVLSVVVSPYKIAPLKFFAKTSAENTERQRMEEAQMVAVFFFFCYVINCFTSNLNFIRPVAWRCQFISFSFPS